MRDPFRCFGKSYRILQLHLNVALIKDSRKKLNTNSLYVDMWYHQKLPFPPPKSRDIHLIKAFEGIRFAKPLLAKTIGGLKEAQIPKEC